MNWRVIVPPDLQQEIWKLPAPERDGLVGLFAQLQHDPHAVTMPYGVEDIGPVRMRSAAVGSVIAVLVINEASGNVTLMQVAYSG